MTFFFICFLVAPILASIPYILIFSAAIIAKEFLIQNTLVNTIINITIAHTANNMFTVESLNAKASHLNNSLFIL